MLWAANFGEPVVSGGFSIHQSSELSGGDLKVQPHHPTLSVIPVIPHSTFHIPHPTSRIPHSALRIAHSHLTPSVPRLYHTTNGTDHLTVRLLYTSASSVQLFGSPQRCLQKTRGVIPRRKKSNVSKPKLSVLVI